MRRKIFFCFFVVLLMTTLVVPAFASSPSGDNIGVLSSDVPIGSMQFSGDGTFPVIDWPHNTVPYSGSSHGYLVSFGDVAACDCFVDYSGRLLETAVYPDLNYSSVTLKIPYLFLTPDTQFYFTNNDEGSLYVSSIAVSGYCISVYEEEFTNLDYYQYSLVHNNYSETIEFDDAYSSKGMDFASWLSSVPGLIGLRSGTYLEDCVFFKDLVITINYSFRTDPDIYSYPMHFYTSFGSSGNTFKDWFNRFDLEYPHGSISSAPSGPAPDLFDWLLDSVNAFLNFELLPNLTLNRLFYIVLVIGILLWFFKMIS